MDISEKCFQNKNKLIKISTLKSSKTCNLRKNKDLSNDYILGILFYKYITFILMHFDALNNKEKMKNPGTLGCTQVHYRVWWVCVCLSKYYKTSSTKVA